MKTNFLFPNRFKKIGLKILIPSTILGTLTIFMEYSPSFLDFNVPALFIDDKVFGDGRIIGITKNNILNEIFGILTIIGSLMVAFSKEKSEDEFISKIRLESLVWATYTNYIVLLFCFIFIYDFSFYWIMVFNMFTTLLFFIIHFNLQISKLKKTSLHEE